MGITEDTTSPGITMPKQPDQEPPSSNSVFIVRALVMMAVLGTIGGIIFGINKVGVINIPFIGQQKDLTTDNFAEFEDIDGYILDSYYLMRDYVAEHNSDDLYAAGVYPAMVVVLTNGKGECQDTLVVVIEDEVRFHMEPLSSPYAC